MNKKVMALAVTFLLTSGVASSKEEITWSRLFDATMHKLEGEIKKAREAMGGWLKKHDSFVKTEKGEIVDAKTKQKKWFFRAELAGYETDQIKIWVKEDESKDATGVVIKKKVLHIEAKKKVEKVTKKKDSKKKKAVKKAVSTGQFNAIETLDNSADIDNISTTYINGVLEVLIPLNKQEEKKNVNDGWNATWRGKQQQRMPPNKKYEMRNLSNRTNSLNFVRNVGIT